MTSRAEAVGRAFEPLRSAAGANASAYSSSSSQRGYEAAREVSETPFVTTLTVRDSELHRVSFAPLYLHDERASKPRELLTSSAPPDITFTPDDSELHPLAMAINPITITLPGLSGVSALRPAETDALLGHVIASKYKILARVGRGGAGVVYKAENLHNGEIIAMKVLTKGHVARPHAASQLRQEGKATARLTHPHTVRHIEFAENEQLIYLAMEYLRGKDLATVLRREGPLPESRVVPIAIQICQSVAEAHRRGIVHRDIKPENVFVLEAADGAPDFIKVLDFGVAHVGETEDSFTQGNSLVYGTPNYMAPEQIRGDSVDARTDVYALGGLIYKALCGAAPFSAATPKGVLDKHLREVAAPMRERLAGLTVSDALEALVARALSKNPKHRQQSMEEMEAELAAVLARGTAGSEQAPAKVATRKRSKRAQPKKNGKKATKKTKKKAKKG